MSIAGHEQMFFASAEDWSWGEGIGAEDRKVSPVSPGKESHNAYFKDLLEFFLCLLDTA